MDILRRTSAFAEAQWEVTDTFKPSPRIINRYLDRAPMYPRYFA